MMTMSGETRGDLEAVLRDLRKIASDMFSFPGKKRKVERLILELEDILE